MYQQTQTKRPAWTWRWPLVITVVAIALVCIQIFRVNLPKEVSPAEPPRVYTPAGSVVNGQMIAPARNFYSSRIDLNRRSRLRGSFRTPKVQSTVSVLVMTENDFTNWTAGMSYQSLAETGYVPGGKINLALEPGVYFLIVDNRQSENDQPFYAEFDLER